MKRIRKTLVIGLLALAVLSLGSCTFVLGLLSSFEVNGETFEVDEIVLFYFGALGGGYDIGVYMLSDGLDIDSDQNLTGSGDYIAFGIVSESSSIDTGEYTYSTSYEAETFYTGWAYTGANFNTLTYDYGYQFDGGNVLLRDALDGSIPIHIDVIGYDVDDLYDVDVTGYVRGRPSEEFYSSVMSMQEQMQNNVLKQVQ